jgi:hypothetical protein
MILVSASGNGIAVWRQGSNIWANRYTAGSGWGTAELMDTDSGTAEDPQIAMDSDGNAIAVWHQGPFAIWANRFE